MHDVQDSALDVREDNPPQECPPHCILHHPDPSQGQPLRCTTARQLARSHEVATDAIAISPKDWEARASPPLGKAVQLSGMRHMKPMGHHDS